MKKQWVIFAAVLCASIVLCTGCGDGSTNQGTSGKTESGETVTGGLNNEKTTTGGEQVAAESLDDIYQIVTDEVEFPEMMNVNDPDYLLNYFGIRAEDIEDGIFYMADNVLQADALVILKGTDADAISALEERLNHYMTSKGNELIDYLPDQYAIVADGRVKVKGSYVYMIISEHADEAERIVTDMLP